jgi:RimJ/RimL family protein N-acetyltransferase
MPLPDVTTDRLRLSRWDPELHTAVHLRLERVIAIIDPGNTPSMAVATRLGLSLEQSVPHPQRPGSVGIYAVQLPANSSQ